MRRIRHKLLLLIPCLINRLHCPASQQDTDDQKNTHTANPNEHAVTDQCIHRCLFAGHIRKNDLLSPCTGYFAVSQSIFRQHTNGFTGIKCGKGNFQQFFLVREIEVAAARGDQFSLASDLNCEKWELHLVCLVTQIRFSVRKRAGSYCLHHLDALIFQP